MTAQDAIEIYKSAKGSENFYIPAFEIKIQGRKLPHDVVRDVMQVTYKDNVNEIDSFELSINNWDALSRDFKYVGMADELTPKKDPNSADYSRIFDPGQELQVYMGYQPDLKLMMLGQITTLEPDFPNGGAPSLSVRGLNILHSFRKKQHTYAWYDKRDSEIAQELGRQPVSDNRPGLGIEVRINDEALQSEAREPYVFMHNQYDIVFLLDRARYHGYIIYLGQETPRSGPPKRYLYFGPPDKKHQGPVVNEVLYKLEWGKSLTQFRPTLTTARQVSQVTVRGWNRRTGRPIEVTVSLNDLRPRPNADETAVARAVEGRHEIIDKPVHTIEQARTLARDTLRKQLNDMIKASGGCVGLPDLRAGRMVQIGRIGPRFSGEYFLTETTHTIGNDGYRTTFNARRERALP